MKRFAAGLAAALAFAALPGCDAVKTTDEEPSRATPPARVVIGGTIAGTSAARPLEVAVTLTNAGADTGVTLRTIPGGTSALRLGAVEVGAGYAVTIGANPFGRLCSVTNGTGIANADVDNIGIRCERDPAVPLYTVTVNLAAGLAAAVPPDLRVSLTTEEGTETLPITQGQTSATFALPLFNSGQSLPVFTYLITATTTSGTSTGNCAVAPATNVSTSGASNPAGNVVATVSACRFTISGLAGYSQPPQLTYTPQPIAGLQLGLKDNTSQRIVETVTVPTFTPATAAATTPFAFPTPRESTDSALYELVVTTQPAGQHCVVDNGGTVSLMLRPASTVDGVTTPATQPANVTGLMVRCRNLPSGGAALAGTYQLVGQSTTIFTGSTGTTVTTTSGTLNSGGSGSTVTTTVGNAPSTSTQSLFSGDRRFLSFFDNGTFLYGVHASTTATSGVEHGFYFHDEIARRIYFTVRSDTNGTGQNSVTTGLSGMPGQLGAAPVMTDVVRTPGNRNVMSGVFGPAGTGANATINRSTWALMEPVQSPGKLEGAWASDDAKRVWVYSAEGLRTGFHMGVNGALNLQDACFAVQDVDAPSGYWARRSTTDSGCTPGDYSVIDLPAAVATGANPAIWPGFAGRMPGSQVTASGSPSPVNYTITPGNPDTLTVQDTLNGAPLGAALTFRRIRPR